MRPKVEKKSVDLLQIQNNVKKLMKQIGFRLSHVKPENDYTEKITHKKFEILVNSLDKTHDEVRKDMCS